ncbi:MAG: TlpA disulfide reductase family protein, partial [Cyclobacteriaceae bacterium]
MRFLYFFSVLSVLVFSACGKQEMKALPGETVISGTIENPIAGGDIILERLGANGVSIIDTTQAEGGEFKFFVKEEAQAFYRINLFDKQYVTFIMSGEDKNIKITADGSKATGDFTISGSKVNDQKETIDQVERDFAEVARNLEQDFLNAKETDNYEKIETIRQDYFVRQKAKTARMKKAIWEALPNLSAIYGVNYLDENQEYQFLDSVANSLKASGKLQSYAQQIIERVEAMRRLAIGSPAPDFTLPNPDGEMISLSSLRGQYVLLDFWAAWCRP